MKRRLTMDEITEELGTREEIEKALSSHIKEAEAEEFICGAFLELDGEDVYIDDELMRLHSKVVRSFACSKDSWRKTIALKKFKEILSEIRVNNALLDYYRNKAK